MKHTSGSHVINNLVRHMQWITILTKLLPFFFKLELTYEYLLINPNFQLIVT